MKLPISTSELLLNSINVVFFYIIQMVFFKYIGSKTNLGVANEIINTIREMVLIFTYNKIDINKYINLTPEQSNELDELKKNRNRYNGVIYNKLKLIVYGAIAAIGLTFLIAPNINDNGYTTGYLRNTFLSETNITLIILTLLTYSTEFYLYFRFISRIQFVTALDFIEDPELYEKNLTKYQNSSLYDIYNDNEIQIINELNKYITKPDLTNSFDKDSFISTTLNELQSNIDNDKKVQSLISDKAKILTRVKIMKKNTNLANFKTEESFNNFAKELIDLENAKTHITDSINNIVAKSVYTVASNTYNKQTKNIN